MTNAGYNGGIIFIPDSVFMMSIVDFEKNKMVCTRVRGRNLYARLATAFVMAATMAGARSQTAAPAPTQIIASNSVAQSPAFLSNFKGAPLTNTPRYFNYNDQRIRIDTKRFVLGEKTAADAFSVAFPRIYGPFRAEDLTHINPGLQTSGMSEMFGQNTNRTANTWAAGKSTVHLPKARLFGRPIELGVRRGHGITCSVRIR